MNLVFLNHVIFSACADFQMKFEKTNLLSIKLSSKGESINVGDCVVVIRNIGNEVKRALYAKETSSSWGDKFYTTLVAQDAFEKVFLSGGRYNRDVIIEVRIYHDNESKQVLYPFYGSYRDQNKDLGVFWTNTLKIKEYMIGKFIYNCTHDFKNGENEFIEKLHEYSLNDKSVHSNSKCDELLHELCLSFFSSLKAPLKTPEDAANRFLAFCSNDVLTDSDDNVYEKASILARDIYDFSSSLKDASYKKPEEFKQFDLEYEGVIRLGKALAIRFVNSRDPIKASKIELLDAKRSVIEGDILNHVDFEVIAIPFGAIREYNVRFVRFTGNGKERIVVIPEVYKY